jgi:lysophospholipase L1-like esterase
MSAHPTRFVFFGDSVCVGQGVSIHHGWVTRLAARIDEVAKLLRQEIIVLNASVNGNTTRQALERMPYDVQSHGVGVLLLQFGMNDCNYWQTDHGLPRVSPKAFAANLEEIISRAFVFGAQRVLVNTNHPTARDRDLLPFTNTTYEASNKLYNSVIRGVVAGQNQKVILNDVETHFNRYVGNDRGKLKELLLDDGLHLSQKGHDFYYELVDPVVEKVIREISGEKGHGAARH